MATDTLPGLVLPVIGVTARFDLDNGDSYIGEVVETHGSPAIPRCTVTIRNYSAWYDGDAAPFNSEYDDEARFSVDHKTRIETF